jgi:hypothetical protein
MKVIPTIGYTFHGRSGRMEGMKMVNGGWLRVECRSGNAAADETQVKHGCDGLGSRNGAGMWRERAPELGAARRPYLVEAGRGGKRWVGEWVQLGKGGWMTGKRTGFSHFETALTHLFPHNSTQVVDFPHLRVVRLFWGKPGIWKTKDVNIVKPGTEGSLRAERKGETHHIYASRYIDFYACNSP